MPTAQQKSGDFSQTFTSANALIKIYDPQTTVSLSEADNEKLMNLLEEIDAHDDVENVFTNAA